MSSVMSIDYAIIRPEIIVSIGLCVVLIFDLVAKGRARILIPALSFGTLAAAGMALVTVAPLAPSATFGDMFVFDGFSVLFKAIAIVAGMIVVLLSMPPMTGHRYEPEYYFLLLCSILGTMLMPSSRDLVMLFIALELVSAPAFIIAGLRKKNPRSQEAALKFFLFGVISAGVFVYGISLVYGIAGSTSLSEISQSTDGSPAMLLGVILIVAAFGFKISAVPFHFWAPDTYEGSPPPLAAFLSVSSKMAGFVGLALILLIGFPQLSGAWGPVVAIISIATMTVGNVVALKQKHLIRLLGYSSIGQAGYMLIPLALIRPNTADGLANTETISALAVYLLIYAVMNLGAFGVAIGVSRFQPSLNIRDLSGLGRRAPFAAFALGAFLLSLAGIPPLAGWAAKFFIFVSAIDVGTPLGVTLACVMVVNSVVSLYYYLGVVKVIFLGEPAGGPLKLSPAIGIAVAVCLLATIAIGIVPEPFAAAARTATIALF